MTERGRGDEGKWGEREREKRERGWRERRDEGKREDQWRGWRERGGKGKIEGRGWRGGDERKGDKERERMRQKKKGGERG